MASRRSTSPTLYRLPDRDRTEKIRAKLESNFLDALCWGVVSAYRLAATGTDEATILAKRLVDVTENGLYLPDELSYREGWVVTEIRDVMLWNMRSKASTLWAIAMGNRRLPAYAATDVWEGVRGLGHMYCARSEAALRRYDVSYHEEYSDFWLCSWHADCAKDHLAYQGKVYLSSSASADARKYAFVHGIATLDSVTLEKPLLLTRPYCRHYVIPVSLEEVQAKRPMELVRDYGIADMEGRRDEIQTQAFYDADEAVEFYRRRRELHRRMARATGDMHVVAMAIKDGILMRSWASRRNSIVENMVKK